MRRFLAAGLWLVVACSSGGELRDEPGAALHVVEGAAKAVELAKPEPAPAPPARTKPLPTLGDPLGLLSKPSSDRDRKPDPAALDPGALRGDEPTLVKIERDPRAVRRGQARSEPKNADPARAARPANVRETSAASLLMRVRQGQAPHVLFVHASYCKACRTVLPRFLEIAERYQKRGVRFSAASVDDDQNAFAGYAASLRGVLEPLWVSPDGTMGDALRAAGLNIGPTSYAIPLVAVFHSKRVIMQGNSREVRELPALLDTLQ
jgi:thiol-disulfide isomerase/thioredoxin